MTSSQTSDNVATQRLILLAGMPRSGTTWLGKIFDSHPATLYRHEPDNVAQIDGLPQIADVKDAEQYRRSVGEFVRSLPDIRMTKVTTTLPTFPKNYYTQPQLLLRKSLILGTKLAGRVFGELPVPDVVDYRRVGNLAIVWKSVRATGRLGVLSRVIEGCRAVLILRHPCGSIASGLRGEAEGRFRVTGESSDTNARLAATEQARAHGLTREALDAMPPVERLAWHWVIYYEKALADIADVPNCRYVLYEDVCREPRAEARKLFEFAGLDWNDQTEAFVRDSTGRESTAYYGLYKDPLRSAYKWKNELPAEQIEHVLAIVRNTRPGALYAQQQ